MISDDKRILLITGANGFLGSEILHQAITAHISTRATDKHTASRVTKMDYRPADMLEKPGLDSLFTGVSQVIHAAGLAHVVEKNREDFVRFKAINENGTANVCEAAAKAGVEHFILISSVSVYGPDTKGVFDESTLCRPQGPYAESKYQAEQRAIEISRWSGMALTILRMVTLYGEQDPGNVARLMRMIDRERFIWVGDGSNLKSLLYRGDAARACLLAALAPAKGFKIYNVSTQPYTMHEVVEGLAAALGRKIHRLHIPMWVALLGIKILTKFPSNNGLLGGMRSSLEKWLSNDAYDSDQFNQTFCFQPKIGLTEGLRREVTWYRGETS